MSSWIFILCISFLLRAGYCLGVGFLFFNSARVPFHPLSVSWLVLLPFHDIVPAMMLFTLVCLVITFGLAVWSACHASFSYYSFFYSLLPSILVGPVHSTSRASPAHFILWAFEAHFIIWVSLAHFIFSYFLHSHGFLLNLLGFPDPIKTSFAFGFISLRTNPIYQFLSLGFSGPLFAFFLFLMILMGLLLHSLELPRPVCFLWGHLLFCGLVNYYFCHSGLMVFTLLLSFSTLLILLSFFCHGIFCQKWASTI